MTESALAQVPAESPAHALNGSIVPPVAKMAAEDYNREGVVRAPPSDRSDPSRASPAGTIIIGAVTDARGLRSLKKSDENECEYSLI